MNDDLLFIEDDEEEPAEQLGAWKVLIVDDEPEVHAVTKLALSDFVLNGKTLDFISAYSGEEACELFRSHADIAVVLLDVVMETDDAGLRVAEYVRNELDNHFTRIILRTGQPGQAPEKDVIINYDINDYKSKTELTAQKLFTVIIAALRSYRDIIAIEENRQGLEKIIDASADMFSTHSLEKFMQGIIQQLSSILGCSQDAAYITSTVAIPNPIDQSDPDELFVFAGNGEYTSQRGRPLHQALTEKEYALCQQALREKSIVYTDDHVVAYCSSRSKAGSLLYLTGLPRRIGDTDKRLVQLFSENLQIAFENVLMNNEIEATQREIIERLGKAMECDSQSSQHIARMIKMAEVLGAAAGLDDTRLTYLRLAMPLHDVGNTRVPVTILEKTSGLSEDEQRAIREHAEFGYQILKNSSQPTIQLAATLARQHHERWDGNGYPNGLKGEEIQLESRLAALVDVFDALYNARPYKPAWPREKVVALLQEQKGRHFDPNLVELVITHIEALVAIQAQFPDQSQ